MRNNLEYCKWLLIFMLMLVWSMFMFMITAHASSLNISDFDLESFTSPLDFNSRNCNKTQGYDVNTTDFGYQHICTMTFSQNEWNNNFLKSNYNFLVVQINHSGVYNNLNFGTTGSTATENMVFMVDYTLNMYVTDINNKSFPCDIVNNNIAMCRYDRSTRVNSLSVQFIFLGSHVTNNLSISSNIFFPKQYNLTSYASMNKAIQEVNNNISNYSINFDSGNSNVSTKVDNYASYLPANGSVSQLLLLPINLITALNNGLNGSCNQFNLGQLLGTDLIMPCIDLGALLGQTLWLTIDIICAGFMIYAMGKKIVRIFNDMTSLKDNQIDDLYGGGA